MLGLARFRPACRIIDLPQLGFGLAAQGNAADALALEPVLQVALDRNFLILVLRRESDRIGGPAARAFLHLEGQAAAIFLIVELAVQTARIERRRIAGPEVERERTADPLPFDVIVAILDGVGINEAVVGHVPTVDFLVVGRELAPIEAEPAGNAETVAELFREIEAALGRQAFGQVVVAAFDLRGEQVLLAVEGAHRVDLDRGADRIGVHVGGQRLLDLDRFDDVAADDVERHRPNIAFGCRKAHAVDRRGVEFGVEPANRHEPPLALVVEDVDAGDAAQRFGDILVGELADRVARQHRGYAVRGALARQRARLVRRLSDDQDLVAAAGTRQRDVDRDAPGFGNLDTLAHRVGADIGGLKRIGARGDIAEAVAAVAIGRRGAAQLDDADVRRLQRARARRVGDIARQFARLRKRGEGCSGQQQCQPARDAESLVHESPLRKSMAGSLGMVGDTMASHD